MDTTDLTEGRKLYRTVSACLIVVFSLKNVFTICMEVAVLGSILSSALCILPEDIVRVHLFSDILFVLALANLAQSIFGVRLSVMHTTSFLLLCPILYYLNLPANKCPSQGDLYAMGPVQRTLEWQSRLHQLHGCFILIAGDLYAMGPVQRSLEWQSRLHQLHGCFILIAVCQSLFSIRRLYTCLTRLISPISLISCVIFLPIALLDTIVDKCSKNIFLSMGTIMLFSIVAYNTNCFKVKICDVKINIFITVSIAWLICFLITWFDLVSTISPVRTDYHSSMLRYIDYVYHYPRLFQWGYPKFSLSAVTIIVPSVLVTIPFSVESYREAKHLQGKRDTNGNISKGLLVDALCSMLNVILGSVTGTQVSYESIQDIAETKIWKRSIVQLSSVLLLVISIWTRLSAYITLIPEPLLGALLTILCVQQVAGCGRVLSTRVDILSRRNVYIIIMSILLPMLLDHGLAALSMPHNTHMSRLILVVTMTTLLDHVTSDQSVSADTLDLVSAQPARAHNLEANDTLNECVSSLEQVTCCCLSCLV
ncbi:hypothetical protein M8J76_006786 [Diaphorina citri]|nr:hypothetical protein M8J76_006786 [Diaphorina citri]